MNLNYKNIHQELINECKAGNSKAQFEIYKLYYKAMYNTSLRIVNNQFDAEDIMQESFLSAFEKIDSYEGNVSFGSWLKKIVVNKSLDCLRRNKVSYSQINESINSLIAEDDENVYLENKFDLDEIKNAIEKLPDGYRIILSLYLLEGYDHDEISQILEISAVTSRTQLLRAKKKLKDILTVK